MAKPLPKELDEARKIVSRTVIAIRDGKHEEAVDGGVELIAEVQKLLKADKQSALTRYSEALKRADEPEAGRLLNSVIQGINRDFIKDNPREYIERGFKNRTNDSFRVRREKAGQSIANNNVAASRGSKVEDYRDQIRAQETGYKGTGFGGRGD